jgi:hypothetical protein
MRCVRLKRRSVCTGTPNFFEPPLEPPLEDLPQNQTATVMQWWSHVTSSITLNDHVILPPGKRTQVDDFVQKGLRLEPGHILAVRDAWHQFLQQHDTLSPDVFLGRGIAIIGGKLQYLVPSLIAIRALRRTGSKLPVELWFPENEPLPHPELQTLIARLGVHIRTLPVPSALGQVCYLMTHCWIVAKHIHAPHNSTAGLRTQQGSPACHAHQMCQFVAAETTTSVSHTFAERVFTMSVAFTLSRVVTPPGASAPLS